MSQSHPELTEEEWEELGYLLSQITDNEIRSNYAFLKTHGADQSNDPETAISARRKIVKHWAQGLVNNWAKDLLPKNNPQDCHGRT